MNQLYAVWLDFQEDESGQDMIEYALVAALIGLGAVVGMRSLATSIKNFFPELVAKFYSAYSS